MRACGVRLDMESRRGGVKKIVDLLVVDLQKRTPTEKLHKITKLRVCVRERERERENAECKPYLIGSGENGSLVAYTRKSLGTTRVLARPLADGFAQFG